MKRAVAFVFLAVSVAMTSGFWRAFTEKAQSSRMKALLRSSMSLFKANVGLDPVKCGQDLQSATSSQFLPCETLIESSLTDVSHFFDYSDTLANTFCISSCPTKVETLFTKIETDCGIGPDQIPSGVISFLPLLCYNKTIIHHDTCLQAWKHLENSTVHSNYENCITSFTGSGCPNACKTAISWLETNVGCCYKELEDFSSHQSIDIMQFLSQNIWDACNAKEPTSCPK